MSRRLVVVLVLLFGTGLVMPPAAQAAKDYTASQYDVKLAIQPGGSMVVTETIRFAFGPDNFTYVSRGLPSRRTDGLTILSVSMDGRAMTPGDEPGQYDIDKQDGGSRRIRWHFDRTTSSVHTFTLTYRVDGVVQHAAASDLLEWWALPTRHEYAIACATLEATYPAGVGLVRAPALDPAPTLGWSGSGPARFERCGFERDDSWLLRMDFAPRSVAPTMPDWQRRAGLARSKMPLFLGLAGMILIAGLTGFAMFGLNHRSHVPRDSGSRRDEPPDHLPVMVGATLAQGGRTTWNTALAAIFDMARRGVLVIDEVPAGRLRQHEFAITSARRAVSLQPAERAIHDALFTTKAGPRAAVKFSELGRVFGAASRWKPVTRAVKAELQAAGLLDSDRARTRNAATAAAVAVIAFGVLGLIAAVPFVREYGGATLVLGAATIVVGLAGLGVAQGITPLTDDATRRAYEWKAYGRHLKALSKGASIAAVTPDALDRRLPFAVAFGVGAAWAKHLLKSGLSTGPSWLRALPREGGGADHMHATVAMLSAGHSAGGSVDHGGVGGAGAGAAGGGSSSAG